MDMLMKEIRNEATQRSIEMIKLLIKEHKFLEAISGATRVLTTSSIKHTPILYALRAKSYFEISDLSKALTDITAGIDNLELLPFEEFKANIISFLSLRMTINKKTNNIKGVIYDAIELRKYQDEEIEAQQFYKELAEKKYSQNKFQHAINLVDVGLTFPEDEWYTSYFYLIKAKCFLKLGEFQMGLTAIRKGIIVSKLTIISDGYMRKTEFLQVSIKLKELVGDNIGASMDREEEALLQEKFALENPIIDEDDLLF